MKRKAYGRDAGLTARMLLTTGLLGLLYVVFAVVLFEVLNAGLVAMVVIVGGLALVQFFTSDRLALAASGAKIVEREQAPALHDMIERLCAMADLPKPRIAVIDTDVPNAFATGRSPKRAAVAVTTGLWERLEPQEVEGVLAHELSHIANRDVLVMTLASFFAMLAGMLDPLRHVRRHVQRWAARQRRRRSGLADRAGRLDRHLRAQLPAHPRDLALPRVRGRSWRRADHRRARAPDERAAEDHRRDDADPAARPAPGRGDERLLHHPDQRRPEVSELFATHPSTEKRLARLAEIAREMGRPVSLDRVGLRDILSGRKQLKQAAPDRLFALSTARVTLEVELGLKTAGAAAVCFKPLSAGEFVRAENEMQELLDVAARDSGSKVGRRRGHFGYEWIIVRDDDLEDLVTTVHLITSELISRGFGEQLLAPMFRFDGEANPVY